MNETDVDLKAAKQAQADSINSICQKDDPWIHRYKNMLCVTCMWHVIKSSPIPGKKTPGKKTLGRCRRRCPTLNGYPAVYTEDWCGDHKLDETKL